MHLAEFLENPIGKGDASIPNKKLIIASLNEKYRVYSERADKDKSKGMNLIILKCSNEVYYYWLVMPSETDRDNTYDVVFKFFDNSKEHKMDLSISQYDFQVFVNTPNFAFTYAYVYNQNGLMIPELMSKLGRKVKKFSPDIRNRNQLVMFDKYIYFAAKYILEWKLLRRDVIDKIGQPGSQGHLVSHIRTLDTIFEEYKLAESKAKQKRRSVRLNNNRTKVNQLVSDLDNQQHKPSIRHVKPVTKKKGPLYTRNGSKPKVAKVIKKRR